MNRILKNKKILLQVMIMCLSVFMVACKSDDNSGTGNTDETVEPVDPVVPVDPDVPIEPDGYHSTLLAKPDSGTPNDFSANENLYIAGQVILNEKYYQTKSTGEVKAKVLFIDYVQTVNNIKIVNDTEVFSQAISYSKLKKVALERFVTESKYFTTKAEKVESVDSAKWSDEVNVLTKQEFLNLYGALPRGLSIYKFTDETITSSELISYEDGLYTYDYKLNPDTATELYKYELKTMSGASELPEFLNTSLQLVINEEWQVQEITISERYKVAIFGNIVCSSVLTEKFTYATSPIEIASRSRYESYLS